MNHYHYCQKDVVNALKSVGLKQGDTVFSHSNIGYFGLPKGKRSVNNAFQTIVNAFLEVIGTEGTLVVPTFSYSFSQGQDFDPDRTPSSCGVFTEMLRNLPGSYRSEEPNISVASIGQKSQIITKELPENAYGSNSFFDRFYKEGGVICNLNFDAGSTFIHYVERCLGVPYRFDKTFSGIIWKNGQKEKRNSTIWVRYLTEGTVAKFESFDQLARSRNLYRTALVGRGFVGAITAEETFNLIKQVLPSRPWFLTEAELLGIEPSLNNVK
ncbi:MAG: AAC(3) family N-acetyltransferase [Cyanobacteria bacterium SBC]|nr:AAC(3) family N-acetyltransferase [Cyanobacteria bacterium SBC]